MRKIRNYKVTAIAAVAIIMLLASYSFSKETALTLHGAISDSQCAFNVHSDARSHDWMKKKVEGARDDKSCTLMCARELGGRYVLVVKDAVYRLDDQIAPEKFAGQKVKVTGTLTDAKTNTLHVTSMEKDE